MDCEDNNESCVGDGGGGKTSRVQENGNGSWRFEFTTVDDNTDHFDLIVSALFHRAKENKLAGQLLCSHCMHSMHNADLKECRFSFSGEVVSIQHYHKICASTQLSPVPAPPGSSDLLPLVLIKQYDPKANIDATTLVVSGNVKRVDPQCPLRIRCHVCNDTNTAGLGDMSLHFYPGKLCVRFIHHHCVNKQI